MEHIREFVIQQEIKQQNVPTHVNKMILLKRRPHVMLKLVNGVLLRLHFHVLVVMRQQLLMEPLHLQLM